MIHLDNFVVEDRDEVVSAMVTCSRLFWYRTLRQLRPVHVDLYRGWCRNAVKLRACNIWNYSVRSGPIVADIFDLLFVNNNLAVCRHYCSVLIFGITAYAVLFCRISNSQEKLSVLRTFSVDFPVSSNCRIVNGCRGYLMRLAAAKRFRVQLLTVLVWSLLAVLYRYLCSDHIMSWSHPGLTTVTDCRK